VYDLEFDRIRKEIRERDAKKILLQLPDGIKPMAFQIIKKIRQDSDVDVFLSGSSCYGACDLAINEALELEADLIVHLGHSEFIHGDVAVPVLYIHAKVYIKIPKLIEAITPELHEWRKIGLVSTIQHAHQLPEIALALREEGFEPEIGKAMDEAAYPGQVLGCNYRTIEDLPDIDGFLFVGPGRFHPIGLGIASHRPVLAVNPYNGTIEMIKSKDIMNIAKKRMAAVTHSKDAEKISIIVSMKPGQLRLDTANKLKSKFEENEKEVVIISMDEVRAESLENFSEVDAFIVTACPRIVVDGLAGMKTPLLTLWEALVILGELKWEELWESGYFIPPTNQFIKKG
jgi:2-(3-amino-3-carboxypropyl)histidine synthase